MKVTIVPVVIGESEHNSGTGIRTCLLPGHSLDVSHYAMRRPLIAFFNRKDLYTNNKVSNIPI